MRTPPYIAIEGVIGVGKTTLATLLSEEYGAEVLLEKFDENPFLPLFYAEPDRYAFQTQIFFLLSRYHQQRMVREHAGRTPLVSDYLFAKDRLFAELNLAGDEWEIYEQLHGVLAERVVTPDLVIYLRASVDTLMGRIARRGRAYEREMSRDYIRDLSGCYERHFAGYTRGPLLVLESDGINVVDRPDDLAWVRARVREALAEPTHPVAAL